MTDIISADENGLGVYDTQTERAANILAVQLGSLEYAPDLGIDLEYFLDSSFQFQNASFKAYLVQVLANQGINVSSVTEVVETLYSRNVFYISPEENTSGMFVR